MLNRLFFRALSCFTGSMHSKTEMTFPIRCIGVFMNPELILGKQLDTNFVRRFSQVSVCVRGVVAHIVSNALICSLNFLVRGLRRSALTAFVLNV